MGLESKPRSVPVILNDVYTQSLSRLRVSNLPIELQTFRLFETDLPVVQGNNIVLWNGSSKIVKVTKTVILNILTSESSGPPLSVSYHSISSYSGGNSLTIKSHDSDDSPPSGLVALKDATVTTVKELERSMAFPATSPSSYAGQKVPEVMNVPVEANMGAKGVILHQNEGLAMIVNNTITDTTFDFVMEFLVDE